MIELVDPPEVRAPTSLFEEIGKRIPKHPIPDPEPRGPNATLTFTFTPRRLIDDVRANGLLIWERSE